MRPHTAPAATLHWLAYSCQTESPLQRWSRDHAWERTRDIPPTPRNCMDMFVKQSGHCN